MTREAVYSILFCDSNGNKLTVVENNRILIINYNSKLTLEIPECLAKLMGKNFVWWQKIMPGTFITIAL